MQTQNIKKSNNTLDRKDFLKQVGTGFGAIMLMNCIQACSTAEIPDPVGPINTGKLDFTVDINAAANSVLKSKGSFLVIKDKNVILARTNDDNWIAVSSKCTHELTVINYQPATNDFRCPNHGAEFKSTGAVQKGPATTALTKYSTTFTANSGIVRIFE
jgi:cytochrome b6-f complex iron-sulfur subunit